MSAKKSMDIVVPSATYPGEKRVMVLPASAKILVEAGHNVCVQAGAGNGINVPDGAYLNVGAKIISEPEILYAHAKKGMVVTLKAPSSEEFSLMRETILFCMLHIGQNTERIYYMGSNQIVGLAMESIRDGKGKRRVDQTDITGQMGVYYSIRHFQRMPDEMNAVVLGYGNVSTGAIAACSKLGIKCKIVRKSEFANLPKWLKEADLLVNGIAWPEKMRRQNNYLVTREDIRKSKPGMIVLDLSVDFPSPIETLHPTDYQNPYYFEEGRVHISIYGYPGLVPISSSRIYSEQLGPMILAIANNGGLLGIGRLGELGRQIRKAIIDPLKFGWERYRPGQKEISPIE